MGCAEAAPAATRMAAVNINFVVKFFIVAPSFGFAAAFPTTGPYSASGVPTAAGPLATAGRSQGFENTRRRCSGYAAKTAKMNRVVHPG
jgi:hypothetical protein